MAIAATPLVNEPLDLLMPALKPSVFDLTFEIVQEAERRVLTYRSFGHIPDSVSRTIIFPFLFIKFGFAELFRPFLNLTFMILVIFVVIIFLDSRVMIPDQLAGYIILFPYYLAILLVFFSVPSTFAFGSTKGLQIHGLADFIHSLGVDCDGKIMALENCLSMLTERTKIRTKSLLWLVATSWAVFMYAFNLSNTIALRISVDGLPHVVADNFTVLLIYGMVSFLIALVIVAYKKSNDAVFYRLQFAIQELKYRAASA